MVSTHGVLSFCSQQYAPLSVATEVQETSQGMTWCEGSPLAPQVLGVVGAIYRVAEGTARAHSFRLSLLTVSWSCLETPTICLRALSPARADITVGHTGT